MQIIIITLLIIIAILASLSLFLFFYYMRINKAINVFLEKGNVKDAREVLFSQIKKTKEIELTLKDTIGNIRSLEDISRVSLQKIGIVRFNPFGDMGGNQSFAIAMLDGIKGGIVVSSLLDLLLNKVLLQM